MTILEKLQKEMLAARKSGDAKKKSHISILLSECERIGKSLDDEQVLELVESLFVTEKNKAKKNIPPDTEWREFLVSISPDLESSISEEQIRSWISDNVDFSSLRNKMQAVGLVKKHFGEDVDGMLVSEVVKSIEV
jgi:uncharacterized protein YqeY